MSLYALVDGKDCGQVATVKGWWDFIEWADRQPYLRVRQLAQHGYVVDVLDLADELYTALVKNPPPADIQSTALGIEEICREHHTADVFLVTDGDDLDDEDIDDEDWDDVDEPRPAKKVVKNKSLTAITTTAAVKRNSSIKKAAPATKAAKKSAANATRAKTAIVKKAPAKSAASKKASVKKAVKKKR